ncbi:MAG: GGDEF domain-containing response regulator [Campylobacterota bacterium]|nr:GGDEF domain-containing response regulator [Campylobacterota bacterium]
MKNIANTLRLLYIDNDEEAIKTTLVGLKTYFKTIDIANSYEEAREVCDKNKPDIVIVDISLCKSDGGDVIEIIRQKYKNLPIIAISTLSDTQNFIKSITLGIDGYLLKPFSLESFHNLLEKVIKTIELQIENETYKTSLERLVKEKTNELNNKLKYDSLTSLLSRASFTTDLEAVGKFSFPIILLINIDGFRSYNELYGLEVGNEVLKAFADFLVKFNDNKAYKIYRIASDEFVLFEDIAYINIERYEEELEELFQSLEQTPLYIKTLDEEIHIHITVGISFSHEDSLSKADMALYSAKKSGRPFIGYNYNIDRTSELEENLYWKKEIKSALDENRVIPHYQPIVNRDGDIVKYEALIRISQQDEDGNKRVIFPLKFLNNSQTTKQYISLTEFMVTKSITTMAEENVHISINLKFEDIQNRTIYKALINNLKKYNVAQQTKFEISNSVIFEILENEKMDDFETFKSFIEEFRELGVKIAIDDFGSGYSNFSQVMGINPDFVKIDGTLIQDIDKNKKSFELVKAIVHFTKELGIKTVAEHIETKEVYDIVYNLGVDEFQGHYFGEAKEKLV